MKKDVLKSRDVLAEARDFLRDNAGLFSMPIVNEKVKAFRQEKGADLFIDAVDLRRRLNNAGIDIINNGHDVDLLPEISEIIRVLDLIIHDNYTHLSLDQVELEGGDSSKIIRLKKKVSLRIEEVVGHRAEVHRSRLADSYSDDYLLDGIPIAKGRRLKSYDVLHVAGDLRGDSRKFKGLESEGGTDIWAFVNLPLDADLNDGHRTGRLWDGYEICAKVLAVRKELDGVCHNGVSITLISNTNDARGFGQDSHLLQHNLGGDLVQRSRNIIRTLMFNRPLIYNGRF